MRNIERGLFKIISLVAAGKGEEAIPLLRAAEVAMGGLGQCLCCCGTNPHSSSASGFGGMFGEEVKDPDLRFPPDTIGHEEYCDLALTLVNLGEKIVYKGTFTEEDRLELLNKEAKRTQT